MARRVGWALLLLWGLGSSCRQRDGDDEPKPAADTDTDTDTDSDSDSDSDSDTDTDTDADTDTASSGFTGATGWAGTAATAVPTAHTGPTRSTGDTSTTLTTGSTGSTGATGASGDTAVPLGAGSVVLTHRRRSTPLAFDEHTTLRGLFADDVQGFVNAAECAEVYSFACVPAWPAADDGFVEVPALYDLDASLELFAGDPLQLGPFTATATPLPRYDSGTLQTPFPASTALDLSWPGAAWPAASLPAAFDTPSVFEPTLPDPEQALSWGPGEVVDFAWGPGDGEVVLLVSGAETARLYGLVDDGSFQLAVDDLGLGSSAELVLLMGRLTHDTLGTPAGPVTVTARSEQWYLASYLDPGTDQVLEVADDCAGAALLPPVADGHYVGDLVGLSDTLDPGAQGCTGFGASGAEGLVPVVVGPGEELRVTYEITGDGSVYLLQDCASASTCLVGADDTLAGQPETLRWFNATGAEVTLSLVLDAYTGGGSFQLDVVRVLVDEATTFETCAEADAAPAVEVGGLTSLDLAVDDLSPVPGDCVGARSDGGDRFVPVEVGPGELLTATVDAGHAYLMADCSDPLSCEHPGTAAPTGMVQFLNDAAVPVRRTLVLDHDASDAVGEVALDLALESVAVAPSDDQCAGSAGLSPLADGTWAVSLAEATATLDPGPAGCTGAEAGGPERFVPIEVAPASLLTVTLHSEGVQAYLLDDCSQVSTCLAGGEGSGSFTMVNPDAVPLAATLVLDVALERGERVAWFSLTTEPVLAAVDADTCAAVPGLGPSTTGVYVGDVGGYGNDLDPTAQGCTGRALGGADALVPVHLEPGDLLTVDAIDGADAVYVVTDCTTAASCVHGSPPPLSTSGVQGAYVLADVATDVVVVADHVAGAGGAYAIDLDVRPTQALAAADSCADAAGQVPLTTGSYGFTGDLSGYVDDLDPTFSGCTGFSADEGDAVVPVSLGPGESLHALYTQPQGDASLYVLADCTDALSCLVGSDVYSVGRVGLQERVDYTHVGASPVTVYLVLDGFDPTAAFHLRLDID